MQCSKCNTVNDNDSKFCKNCGQYMIIDNAANTKKPDDNIRVGELIYSAYTNKEAGRIDEAILACQGAITLNPKSASAHGLLASLYEAREDYDLAIDEYRKVLQIEPDNTTINEKIAFLDNINHNIVVPEKKFVIDIDKIRPYLPIISAAASLLIVLLVGFMIIKYNMNKNVGDTKEIQTKSIPPQQMNQYQQNPQYSNTIPQSIQQPASPSQEQMQNMQMNQQQTPSVNNTQPMQMQPAKNNNRPITNNRRGIPPVRLPNIIQSNPVIPSGVLPVISPMNDTKQPVNNTNPVIVPVDGNKKYTQPNVSQPSIIYQNSPNKSESNKTNVSPIQPVQDPEERAMQLQGSGKYEEAIQVYKNVVGKSANKGRTYQQMALSYQRTGKNKEASDSYKKAIAEYKSQLTAGRDPSEVDRDIRSCEAGLKTVSE